MSQYIRQVPGRIRIRSKALRCYGQRADAPRSRLLAMDGVRNVEINPRAASLLVQYDPQTISRSSLLAALEELGCMSSTVPRDGEHWAQAGRDLRQGAPRRRGQNGCGAIHANAGGCNGLSPRWTPLAHAACVRPSADTMRFLAVITRRITLWRQPALTHPDGAGASPASNARGRPTPWLQDFSRRPRGLTGRQKRWAMLRALARESARDAARRTSGDLARHEQPDDHD
jgi:hypothetical protein